MPNRSLQALLMDAFADESAELLTQLRVCIADLDRGTEHPNQLLARMKRLLHTLKGAATSVGKEEVSLVCQALDEFAWALANGERPFDRVAIERLRRALRELGNICQGESRDELFAILRSLRADADRRPSAVQLYPSASSPGISVPDGDLTTQVELPNIAHTRAALATIAEQTRALHRSFSGLRTAWLKLRADVCEQDPPVAAALDEFSARFDTSISDLVDIVAVADTASRQMVRQAPALPSLLNAPVADRQPGDEVATSLPMDIADPPASGSAA